MNTLVSNEYTCSVVDDAYRFVLKNKCNRFQVKDDLAREKISNLFRSRKDLPRTLEDGNRGHSRTRTELDDDSNGIKKRWHM
jgi:hypothetical protein